VVVMGARDAAQAVVLIRALSDVRDKMISRMTWLQLEAAALQQDINEAEAHIAGLQRRYGLSASVAGHAWCERSSR
jgi:hypothetical protein